MLNKNNTLMAFSRVFWGLFLVLTFIVTLPVSWWLMTKIDFAYPILYEQISIEKHIEKYAPLNNKKDFELTSKEKRLALFHDVVVAIHNSGQGLTELSYNDSSHQKVALFTQAEITHLSDVAKLLNKLKPVVVSISIVWLFLVLIIVFKKLRLPTQKQYLVSSLFLFIFVDIILALGPNKIFNQLHEWVFPKNHQWFFYYQESLMSTLMKAPDLFGYIAGMWGFISVFFTVVCFVILRYIKQIHNENS